MSLNAQRLVEAGGKEWRRDSRHRVYFENIPGWYGLKWETDPRSGTITEATLDGAPVTTDEARELLAKLKDVKIWYDVGKHEFQWRHAPNIKRIADKVVQSIQRALPPETPPDPSRIHDYGSPFHIEASKHLELARGRGDVEGAAQAAANLMLVKPRPTTLVVKKTRRWSP